MEAERCLNCGGSEKSVHTRGSTCYYVCRDCDWPWGERPTKVCPGCNGAGYVARPLTQRGCTGPCTTHDCVECDGTGRIDASHLPLCSICS